MDSLEAWQEADLLRQRATALFSLGRSRDAVEVARNGLDLLSVDGCQSLDAIRVRARLLGFYGNALLSQGRVREALVALEEAIALARAHDMSAQLGVYLSSLGNTRIFAGDPRSAKEYYEEALALAREHTNKEGEAVNLGNLGLAHYVTGDLNGALERFEQALGKAREVGDRRSAATLEANIGMVLGEQGDLPRAQLRTEASLELARQLGDRATEAMALLQMAVVSRQRGELDGADRLLGLAGEALRSVGDPRREAVLDELGRLALDRQDVSAAAELFAESLQAAQDVNDPRGEAVALYDLGRTDLLCGQPDAARGRLDTACASAQQLSAKRLVAFVCVAQAETLLALGDSRGAGQALNRAAPLAEPCEGALGLRYALAQAACLVSASPERARALLKSTDARARQRGFTSLAAEVQRRRQSLEGK